MAKTLSALLFAAALSVGFGAGSTVTYACPMQNAQAERNATPVQLAMEEADDASDKAAKSEKSGEEEKSE